MRAHPALEAVFGRGLDGEYPPAAARPVPDGLGQTDLLEDTEIQRRPDQSPDALAPLDARPRVRLHMRPRGLQQSLAPIRERAANLINVNAQPIVILVQRHHEG